MLLKQVDGGGGGEEGSFGGVLAIVKKPYVRRVARIRERGKNGQKFNAFVGKLLLSLKSHTHNDRTRAGNR